MKSISDVMIQSPQSISDKATVHDAIVLFSKHGYGCLPVVDDNQHVVAFLSDGDIISYLARKTKQQDHLPLIYASMLSDEEYFNDKEILDELMTISVLFCATKKVLAADINDNLAKVTSLMDNKHLKHLPILENDKLVGLLSRRNVILSFFDSYNAYQH